MKVLISGGAGFIGSTIASACLDAGIVPIILDNLSTGEVAFVRDRIFYLGDIDDRLLLDRIFFDHPDIVATIHCAAVIVVPDSVREPMRYYRENLGKSIDFVAGLIANNCHRFIFSSTAAVYGDAATLTVDETTPMAPTSPYARSKSMLEQVLADVAGAGQLQVISLRYFNPIGADPLLRSGSQHRQPSHLLGRLIEAARTGSTFTVTGDAWPTRDGTGIRDYVHVWDLARAHVNALHNFAAVFDHLAAPAYQPINLGSGNGTTVMELLNAFVEVTGERLAVAVAPPRAGDLAGGYASCELAQRLLGWIPKLSIEDGVRDAMRWAAIRDTVTSAATPTDGAG